MACAGNYEEDDKARDEEKQLDRKLAKDIHKASGIDFDSALREVDESFRFYQVFNWPPAETTVVVIGIGKGIESEFAFQRKCPSIVYLCYIYTMPT